MGFLLDTDVSSAYLEDDPRITARVMLHYGGLHVSAVTVGELMVWALRANAPPRRLRSVQRFLLGCQVLDVDQEVAQMFGQVRAGLLDAGRPVGELDLLNASVALVHGLTVVTHNVADYRDVPGLPIVDWMAP